tara:strand:- start:1227 stop:1568 length:342 start_codon:yes stop_codon:yes gene_type:complete
MQPSIVLKGNNMAIVNHMPHSTFADRASQLGNVQLVHVDAQHEQMPGFNYTIELSYTFRINGIMHNTDFDEFERRFLGIEEFERVQRIINSNPELKDLYDKYDMIDRLQGKDG